MRPAPPQQAPPQQGRGRAVWFAFLPHFCYNKVKIPENHYAGVIIGFGYPEIKYARGACRTLGAERIHRVHIEEEVK